MTISPQVSVVMSVYNGAETLPDSIESVLSQGGVDLELIVVNDGSTDSSGALINQFAARDARIRAIHQENQGLTRALVRGCSEARGRYIARQDAGDLFLPDKLRRQIEAFNAHPDAALISCGTRVIGPGGEFMRNWISCDLDHTAQLLTLKTGQLRGPFGHGSALFRRDLYEKAGGYRKEFCFAQDIDLWIRLAEVGRFLILPEILFQVVFELDSISGAQRRSQIASAKLALECARLRRAGASESRPLSRASLIRPQITHQSASDRAMALYYVGVWLRRGGDSRARHYFREALRADPLHFKSAIRLLWG